MRAFEAKLAALVKEAPESDIHPIDPKTLDLLKQGNCTSTPHRSLISRETVERLLVVDSGGEDCEPNWRVEERTSKEGTSEESASKKGNFQSEGCRNLTANIRVFGLIVGHIAAGASQEGTGEKGSSE